MSRTYLGNKLAVVNVEIGSADTAGLDLDQDIVIADGRERNFDDRVLSWLLVAI